MPQTSPAPTINEPEPDHPFFRHGQKIVLFLAFIICFTSILTPPRLMDDLDAGQGDIARNILKSGDWVTPYLDGVKFLDKSPPLYWMIAVSFKIFGDHDWAARIPQQLFGFLLTVLAYRMALWGIGKRAALYSGLAMATSTGLWLFTRVNIPDILVTVAIGFALWFFLRSQDAEWGEAKRWALAMWASAGLAVFFKGLIGAVLPTGVILLYFLLTGAWKRKEAWGRLRIGVGLLVFLAVALPWHVLAVIDNPPYFDFTMRSEPGVYRGFFWFYIINEHVLRFLNLRYPHDYSTVPPLVLWPQHLIWFCPWSVFLLRAASLRFRPVDRESRMHLLCVCWIVVILGFFSVSTTQEYYTMPSYPAFAVLIGSAIAAAKSWKLELRVIGVLSAIACAAIGALLWASRGYATPGDISTALGHYSQDTYMLSLGHMGDLTVRSFAYLRTPLAMAGLATLLGAAGCLLLRDRRAIVSIAVMMALFFQAARLALIAFDPYLSSYPLAEAINAAPPGGLILDDPYHEFSSLGFYTHKSPLMLNGRVNNLEYGSYAPGAGHVFIDDRRFLELWNGPQRWYIASEDNWDENPRMPTQNHKPERLRALVGTNALHVLAHAGGKTVYYNH